MTTIRLILGVALVSLCVFGVPEGCLVFASHVLPTPDPISTTDTNTRIAPQWIGGGKI